ncbi:hypothetical protein ACTULT_004664, partial [Escherichia coli]
SGFRYAELLKLKPYSGYTGRTAFGICAPSSQLPQSIRRGRRLLIGRKKPPQGGFFRLQAEDYAQLKRISRRSF